MMTEDRCRLNIFRDSAFRIGVGSSFHQPGTVNENVLEVILHYKSLLFTNNYDIK